MAMLPTARFQGGGDKYATGANPSIKLLMKGTIIGTWNVFTLHACCKLHEPTHGLMLCKVVLGSFPFTIFRCSGQTAIITNL